ncbi:tRNA dihydrouridine(20/20a) synthase DusA [Clostridium sp. D2Q-11]|uniref:tRNA-dihydrouridine(20/20a) synthase n=1 Tax=Anaeromonas frigoriresistens TaxID=2683708 RepID=A0A942UYV5_9FIRM|nr:tRNA dihydrouridine(20/20a) synthase DusA [Anaeromonas frigoriresistens]MBS4539329.1 tRNA dihydrouridine(20/20a) synthase DusA [Anaeromonas frigoriresistens]
MSQYISNIKSPKVSIAPMVDRTDRHFRYFTRLLTKKSLLYTEMITAQAIIHGDRNMLLDFDVFERPLALQIAGCDAKNIGKAVKIAEGWDYDEINLNVGCPSDRVSGNEMGASLMAYPELVRDMVKVMKENTDKPITVKHRIGIDGNGVLPDNFGRKLLDKYEDLTKFVDIVEEAKVDRFTVHARIAILAGLSPKENREIPPIRYADVYKLKNDFPHLNIEINGGIKTTKEIKEHLNYVDGVMIGRAAYDTPFILSEVDKFFDDGEINNISRREVIEGLIQYLSNLDDNTREYNVLKHAMGLFYGVRGSKNWRQLITPPWDKEKNAVDVLREALEILPQDVLNMRVQE